MGTNTKKTAGSLIAGDKILVTIKDLCPQNSEVEYKLAIEPNLSGAFGVEVISLNPNSYSFSAKIIDEGIHVDNNKVIVGKEIEANFNALNQSAFIAGNQHRENSTRQSPTKSHATKYLSCKDDKKSQQASRN